MAVFYCQECDNYIDIDWVGCEEHPYGENELICCDCFWEKLHDEDGRLIPEEVYRERVKY